MLFNISEVCLFFSAVNGNSENIAFCFLSICNDMEPFVRFQLCF